MHKGLEDYLGAIEKNITSLPQERRNEELQEIRQHLLSAVAVYQGQGQTEDQAVATALQQFGRHKALSGKIVRAWRREKEKEWKSAPPEVLFFLVFSFLVTLFDFWLDLAGPALWRETVRPYINHSISIQYLVSLCSANRSILFLNRGVKVREYAVIILPVGAAVAALDYAQRLSASHTPPYPTVSLWEPVWTVILPLAWLLILWIRPIFWGRRTRQTAG